MIYNVHDRSWSRYNLLMALAWEPIGRLPAWVIISMGRGDVSARTHQHWLPDPGWGMGNKATQHRQAENSFLHFSGPRRRLKAQQQQHESVRSTSGSQKVSPFLLSSFLFLLITLHLFEFWPEMNCFMFFFFPDILQVHGQETSK